MNTTFPDFEELETTETEAFSQVRPISTTARATSAVLVRPSQARSVIESKQRPQWVSPCMASIESLRQLHDNWNSYGSKAVDPRSIDLAKALLEILLTLTAIPKPVVTASPDGNVAFCWDDGVRSVDAEILPDPAIRYAYLNERDPSQDSEGITRDLKWFAGLLTRQ